MQLPDPTLASSGVSDPLSMPLPSDNGVANSRGLSDEEFSALEDILDDLRKRAPETPQWEFCDGFLAALAVCRRQIPAQEYLGALLDLGDADVGLDGLPDSGAGATFSNPEQARRFMDLWTRRWNAVIACLDAPVESLDDDAVYYPSAMDLRGLMANLPEGSDPGVKLADLPAYGQVWALGFMYAVETWPEEWAPPRDREMAEMMNSALDALVALTEDDTGPAEISMLEDEGAAPSISQGRMEDFAAAIWALYDLRGLGKSLGPRRDPVRAAVEPGRNDPCSCGSGKKYKKCCGA